MSATIEKPWSEMTEREKAMRFAEAFGVEACYLTIGHVMHVAERERYGISITNLRFEWECEVWINCTHSFTATSKTIADALAQALLKTI